MNLRLSTVYLFLCCLCGCLLIHYTNAQWTFQQSLFQSVNIYSRSPFVIYGRGAQTVLSGYNRNISEMYIDVSLQPPQQQYNIFSLQAIMQPPDSIPAILNPNDSAVSLDDGDMYGWWISMNGNYQLGKTFAVTAPYKESASIDDEYHYLTHHTGSVYMYRGDFKMWSNTQLLLPPDEDNENLEFGSSVSLDIVSNLAMVVSTARAVNNNSNGAVYVYAAREDGGLWSYQQKLEVLVQSFNGFGRGSVIFGGVIASFATFADIHGKDTGAVYVFSKLSSAWNSWSFHSVLINDDHSNNTHWGQYFSLFDNTIAVGFPQDDTDGIDSGAVYCFYCVPSQSGCNWSQQQKLFVSDPHEYRYFGTTTALYNDLLASGGFGDAFSDSDWTDPDSPNYVSGSAYIFKRNPETNRYSQQQKLILPNHAARDFFSDVFLFGSSVIVRGNSRGHVFVDSLSWNCLVINLMDIYGDGWDTARLVVSGPSEAVYRSDSFNKPCSLSSEEVYESYQFRFCPATLEESGYYQLSIPGYHSHLFWSEALWEVFIENNDEVYRGNVDTSMTFFWSSSSLSFSKVETIGLVTELSKSQSCPVQYNVDPLEGKSIVLTLLSSKSNLTFFIYDSSATSLLYTGSLVEVNSSCHLPLWFGEDYLIRVATDSILQHEELITWTFCNVNFSGQASSDFALTSSGCEFYSDFGSFCAEDLGPYQLISGSIIINIYSWTIPLSDQDLVLVSNTLRDLIQEIIMPHRIVAFPQVYNYSIINFNIYQNLTESGYSDAVTLANDIADCLVIAELTGTLLSNLIASTSSSSYDSGILSKLTRAVVLEVSTDGESVYFNDSALFWTFSGEIESPFIPTTVPTASPSSVPTHLPTRPTYVPSVFPTKPTYIPTSKPTLLPTSLPSILPSTSPSLYPTLTSTTRSPTIQIPLPTLHPSFSPTSYPSHSPTTQTTSYPSHPPIAQPTSHPSLSSIEITSQPTHPSHSPTHSTPQPTGGLSTLHPVGELSQAPTSLTPIPTTQTTQEIKSSGSESGIDWGQDPVAIVVYVICAGVFMVAIYFSRSLCQRTSQTTRPYILNQGEPFFTAYGSSNQVGSSLDEDESLHPIMASPAPEQSSLTLRRKDGSPPLPILPFAYLGRVIQDRKYDQFYNPDLNL